MFSILLKVLIPIFVESTNNSEVNICYKSVANKVSLTISNKGWFSCHKLDQYLSPTGDLFGEFCKQEENFGLKCAKRIVKCRSEINLCIEENPLYKSQLNIYKRLRYRMKHWSSFKFNSTLMFARKVRPPNGGDNGAFDSLSNAWLRRHHIDDYNRIESSLSQMHINQVSLSCIIIQLCRLINSNETNQRLNSSIEIIGRIKSLYSIWSKEQRIAAGEEEHTFITDQYSIKIIVDTIEDCYTVFYILTQRFSVLRTADFIAKPKKSGYQAIHVVLLGEYDNQFVEIQIVTNLINKAQMGEDHTRYKTMQDTRLYE